MTLRMICTLAACLVISGCNSLKNDETEVPLDQNQIKKALAAAKAPQQFGFTVYPTANNNIAMSGRARLHPMQTASVDFISSQAPVIKIEGSARRMKVRALIDPASAESWFEYSKALEFRTSFLGLDGRVIDYRGGANIGNAEAYAAVIPQIRIKQLFIEDSPVYVRMALNTLGPLNRGYLDSKINCVLGYNTLSAFEFIQIDLVRGTVSFSSTGAYKPNADRLIGTAQIVQQEGAGLAVQGGVNGKETPILLDIAGNFDFAMNTATMNTTAMVEMGEVVYVKTPTIRIGSADGLPRAGANMLRKYLITICPQAGTVYFERPGL